MPKLEVTVPHKLTEQEALARLKNMISDLQKQFAGTVTNVQENWNGNLNHFSFQLMGYKVAGTLSVGPSEIALNSDLPFAAIPFRGKIESSIREKATQLLS